jgi:SAM-dependent methyltransferase
MKPMPNVFQGKSKIKMRPELELVLCASRAKSPVNEDRIRTLLHENLNWSEVLASAHQHKLGPLLDERLRALDGTLLPQDQKQRLALLARDLAKNNLAYMGEMLWLCGTFDAAGIPAVPFKGPALGWLAYPNFAQRTCVDLDFVLPQRYIPQAMSLLEALGYSPQFDAIEAQAGERGPAPGQYPFVSSGKRIFVELHTQRTLRYFSSPLNLDEMNSRLIRFEIGGRKISSFSVEDQLVMLSVHGAKHFWERLAWIVDIAQLISIRQVNWPLLFEIAEKMQSTRLLLLGLYLAHEVVGASLPPFVLDRLGSDKRVQWLTGKVIEQYAGTLDPNRGVGPRALFRFRSSDRFWPGLRQLLRLSMSPTESDRQTMHLPGFLSPFYTIVRPFRLLGEYGMGLRRRMKPDLAIYLPTPKEIVDLMLDLARLFPEDILYDLGCGDGRIVVAAAEKYGIRAVGVDVNPKRIAEARDNARRHGVERRVEFIQGDAKKMDLGEATVVTMYLGADANFRLADRLRADLRPGARIVSRDFKIYGWAPERTENLITAKGAPTTLYLWTIKNSVQESAETTNATPERPRTSPASSRCEEETEAHASVWQRDK